MRDTLPRELRRGSARQPVSLFRCLVLLVLLVLTPRPLTAGELVLRFLDVGQGDAALATCDGKAALLDTGPANDIVERLQALGVNALDLLLVTHNHADHLGGADALLAALPVRFYLDNELPAKTKLQETVLRLVEARHVSYLAASARTIALGSASLRILPPPASLRGRDQNDESVGVLIEKGRFRALVGGDAEIAELSAWLAADRIPDLDVLKASHHGSRNGVTPALLEKAKPEVVVISVGAGNDYGHPHAAAMRYYEAGGRRVLRTDRDGDVVVTVQDDGTYEVTTTRSPTAAPPPRTPPRTPARTPAAAEGAEAP